MRRLLDAVTGDPRGPSAVTIILLLWLTIGVERRMPIIVFTGMPFILWAACESVRTDSEATGNADMWFGLTVTGLTVEAGLLAWFA